MTSTALVETKLFPPRPRDGEVLRPRLDDLMDQTARLTLVSAPAGFGKTTLVGSWAAERAAGGSRLAWVSLDSGDQDAATFWTYVLTALNRAAPGTASGALTALGSGQPIEAAIGSVVNELSVLPDDAVLVLDDFHLADGPLLQPGLAFFLERLPPQVRLIITTRSDPALPLARMRARGELVEVRAADLRFTDDEASTFLTAATGRELDAGDVTALSHRTEGWVASLQLAALSLRGRDDPSAFIAGFAGDDRHVVDYLIEEVLSHETDEVRAFLLDTSVLDRLSGPLCDAVTGTGSGTGAGMLESLDRRNLFVVPLDDQRRWYRYHHLFADVLRARLLAERPGDLAELHRRASRWFDQTGQPEEAVRHALAGADLDGAADLVERALPELRRQRREQLLRSWAEQLPDDIVRDRPVLAVGLVSGLMASNDFTDVDRRLRDIQETLDHPPVDLRVLDAAELDRLPAAVKTYRAGLALVAGDLVGAIAHADDAQAAAPPDDDLTRAAAAGLAGLAHWASGDILEAHAAYTTCAAGLERADHIADVLGCSLTLADMELALGRLRDAQATLERAVDLADRRSPTDAAERGHPPVLRGTADMYVGLSRAAWHRNELDQAAELLGRADDVGEAAGLPQHPYRWRVALARLRAAAGDHGTALDLLDEAERVYVADFSPPVHPIHATRARVQLASGDLDGAVSWATQHQLTAHDPLSYLREYEHLTLARVLLAQHHTTGAAGSLDAATGLLDRLLHAAEAGRRLGTVIEVEVVRARAYAAAGDAEVAAAAIEHAVDLAEPDGWTRYFVDAGPALRPLLASLSAQRPDSVLLSRLVPDTTTPEPPSRGAVALPDPLSDRELDVLRLLATDLDGPAIARHLVVSLNTVRTHTKHIYTKLDVNSRRAAVSRAHQLGLLNRGPEH